MAFSPQQLIALLPDDKSTCYVGFSGGMDSHVLLHALCKLLESDDIQLQLKVVHVHHGLSENADFWVNHCQTICQDLNVSFVASKVRIDKAGQGLESAARNARLDVFQEKLKPGDYMLTAHHLDDQMETMLFRMMRGAGLRGLSAMSVARPLGHGTMLRPLLAFSRSELKEYALQEGLSWIEDESNQVVDFDRNYLRQEVMPLLSARWPGFRRNWQRLAQLADEGETLQRELGLQDLVEVQAGCHRLNILALQKFSPLRQRNIVRCWFLSLEDSHAIAAPDYNVIQRIFTELIPAAEDASPLVSWEKGGQRIEIRRYADHIYLVLPLAAPINTMKLRWDTASPLELPGCLGQLRLTEDSEAGVAIAPGEVLYVSFKQGGESVKPLGRKTRPLKKVLQDYHVPPWVRETIPIIFRNDDVIAVADLFVADKHGIKKNKQNMKKMYKFQWRKSDLHCGY